MAVPTSTYTGPIDLSINNTPQGADLVNANKEQAAKMGVTIPGATPAPVTTPAPTPTPAPTATPPATPTAQPDTGTSGLTDQGDRTALTQAQTDLQTAAKKFQDTIDGIQNGSIPLSAGEQAQVDALKGQYDQFVQDAKAANDAEMQQQNILDSRQGRTQYMPGQHLQTIADIASKGAAKVRALTVEQAGKVAELTQSLKDNDISKIKDVYKSVQDANTARQDALKTAIKDTQDAIDKANAAKIAADKVTYDTVTKPIQDLQQTARDNGAPNSVVNAIGASKNLDDAYAAAGNYAAHGTGVVAEYNYAKANGYAGSFLEYQNQLDMQKALATAAASGNGGGIPGLDTPAPTGLGADGKGGSILQATGLSYWAFKALAEGSTALARFSQQQRQAIGNEIKAWSDKNGVDISTFTAQYKGLNEVVQNNQARENNTLIAGEDVSKTADNLIADMQAGGDIGQKSLFGGPVPTAYTKSSAMGTLRAANILDLMAGKQVNNEFAQKYSTDLNLLTNDLAGYLAASRSVGANGSVPTPDDSDKATAANIIANGINKGGAEAFKQAIDSNKQKVVKVVSDATIDSQKKVWNLFGVGDKYAAPMSATDGVLQAQQSNSSYNGISLPGSTGASGGTYNGIALPH